MTIRTPFKPPNFVSRDKAKTVDVVYTVYGSYFFFADFAVALGARINPDPSVSCVCVRIWANGTLIYDKQSGLIHPDLKFKFYPGTPTQRQDPTMVARLGAEATPAHRDLMYLVFTEFNCSDFEGSIPAITAEIVDGIDVSVVSAELSTLDATFDNEGSFIRGDIDSDLAYKLVQGTPDGGDSAWQICKYRLTDRIELQRARIASADSFRFFAFAPWIDVLFASGGTKFCGTGGTSGVEDFYAISMSDGGLRDIFISDTGVCSDAGFTSIANIFGMTAIRVDNSETTDTFLIMRGVLGRNDNTQNHHDEADRTYIFYYDVSNLRFVLVMNSDVVHPDYSLPDGEVAFFYIEGQMRVGETDVYVPVMKADGIWNSRIAGTNKLHKMTVGEAGSAGLVSTDFGIPPPNINRAPAVTTEADWFTYDNGGAWPLAACYAGKYIKEEDTLVTLWTGVTQSGAGDTETIEAKVVKINCADATIIWESATFTVYGGDDPVPTFLPQSFKAWESANTADGKLIIPQYASAGIHGVGFVDLETGDITSDTHNDLDIDANAGMLIYDSRIDTVWDLKNNHAFRFNVPDLPGFALTVPDAITAVAEKAGYDAVDVDVSGLSTFRIDGYIIDGPRSLNDMLGGLAVLYDFSFHERDDQLLVSRKKDVDGNVIIDMTVSAEELAFVQDDVNTPIVAPKTIAPDTELPNSISLTYFDSDDSYMPNSQSVRRQNAPNRTQQSNAAASFSLPLVIGGSEILGLMYTMLYNVWGSRTSFDLRLPTRFMEADPGDILEFTSYGTTYKGKIGRIRRNADWSVSATVSTIPNSYPVSAETQTPTRPRNDINVGDAVFTAVMDIPALTAYEANIQQNFLYLRVAVSNYWANEWQGALFEGSDTGAPAGLTLKDAWVRPAQTAFVSSPLVHDVLAWHTDYDSELIVANNSIDTDELVAATYEELLADEHRNLMCIGQGVTWELVQWMDFEILDERRIAFRGFFRGRFGTEYFRDTSKAGSTCVLISVEPDLTPPEPGDLITYGHGFDTNPVRKIRYPRSMIFNPVKPYFYRARGGNSPIWRGQVETLPLQGNYRKPLAPINVRAVRDPGTGEVTITWTRRARFNAGLRDGTGDVILDEQQELYSVDILNTARTAAIRRIDNITAETVLYGPNSQAQDGYHEATELYILVYQLSNSHVGRGFPGGGLISVE